jgi:hypothetical protein
MRSQLSGATIVYVDIYSIKYDLIANSSKYGKKNLLIASHWIFSFSFFKNILYVFLYYADCETRRDMKHAYIIPHVFGFQNSLPFACGSIKDTMQAYIDP